jgi:BirA family biotin operon repressor/biotin-[acetyl-CoA-carboxylase] ligase
MSTSGVIHLEQTDSTNSWVVANSKGEAGDLLVWTDYQTAGRGCGTNSWESEAGQNLLFSMLIHPGKTITLPWADGKGQWPRVEARRQFVISMAISVALVKALADVIAQAGADASALSIKWPNDIYWHDRKLAGILIEQHVASGEVTQCIIGVGLNVNQTRFRSDAPNPISLAQITGSSHSREALLRSVVEGFALDIQPSLYRSQLYRRTGCHTYRDTNGPFQATMLTVEDDGHLLLEDTEGHRRRYAFKEVSFEI